jgi:Flp pilus assembly protein CpaB
MREGAALIIVLIIVAAVALAAYGLVGYLAAVVGNANEGAVAPRSRDVPANN